MSFADAFKAGFGVVFGIFSAFVVIIFAFAFADLIGEWIPKIYNFIIGIPNIKVISLVLIFICFIILLVMGFFENSEWR